MFHRWGPKMTSVVQMLQSGTWSKCIHSPRPSDSSHPGSSSSSSRPVIPSCSSLARRPLCNTVKYLSNIQGSNTWGFPSPLFLSLFLFQTGCYLQIIHYVSSSYIPHLHSAHNGQLRKFKTNRWIGECTSKYSFPRLPWLWQEHAFNHNYGNPSNHPPVNSFVCSISSFSYFSNTNTKSYCIFFQYNHLRTIYNSKKQNNSLLTTGEGDGGLVAGGLTNSESRVGAPVRAGHFSLLIPPSSLRSPTCCHNTIFDGTAKLYAQGTSAGNMSLSIRNEASLKKSNLRY